MDDKQFNELVESVEQAGSIRRGEAESSREQTAEAIVMKPNDESNQRRLISASEKRGR